MIEMDGRLREEYVDATDRGSLLYCTQPSPEAGGAFTKLHNLVVLPLKLLWGAVHAMIVCSFVKGLPAWEWELKRAWNLNFT